MRLIRLYLFLALYLGAHAANGDVSFTLLGATGETYMQFIKQLREALTVNSQKVYNIPVLPATASGSSRFILIHLTNYQSRSITVGIDVVNVYIVAYRTGTRSFFLAEASTDAYKFLFKDTTQTKLPYSGNYNGLESAAGVLREKVDLGFSTFSSAIDNLFYYNAASVPRAFLVIIQMISEAARFKYIEYKVSQNVATTFTPGPEFLSLENRWSDLSEQIQIAQSQGGQFARSIEIRNFENKPIMVTNVTSKVVKGVALLLYYNGKVAMSDNKTVVTPHTGIGMPIGISQPCISGGDETTVAMIAYICGNTHRKSLRNIGRFKVMDMERLNPTINHPGVDIAAM